ncbi:conserved hypothetical protein [Ixodes scapularis]|uniref:Uncharacterized protein n=1 Tax=Ixodes scapularis TaxID=6945 RepID=B7PP72_IXOSC|nr:conserved hypothetical protein [Ixodes scapularis]|eukprot:XP_002435564.1 conserved hypothetical protein [Ixodes scapularis]
MAPFCLAVWLACAWNSARASPETVPFSSAAASTAVTEGRSHYEALVAQGPLYGPCWLSAVANLHRSCKQLTEETQSRVALDFTNCFLKNLGLSGFDCPAAEPLSQCSALRNMSGHVAFSSYSQFFTHTQVICQFLQSQLWQAQTERTVSVLAETSVRVSRDMQRAADGQEHLLRLQHDAQEGQRQLLANGRLLGVELAQSRRLLTEQHSLLGETAEQLYRAHAFFVGQFAAVQSVAYYFMAVVLSLLLTVPKRMADARSWLLLLFTANVCVEKLLADWMVGEEATRAVPLAYDGPLKTKIAWCRRTFCTMALGLYARCWYSYQDYMQANNLLLLNLQKDLRCLQESEYDSDLDSTYTCPEAPDDAWPLSPWDGQRDCLSVFPSATPTLAKTQTPEEPILRTTSTPVRYNLRPRRPSSVANGSLLRAETPAQFASQVRRLSKLSRQLGVMSSDED